MLDTAQLAFLTADPGLVQQSLSGHLSSYQKRKLPEHGVPNQMDRSEIWSKYTSDATALKLDDIQERIKQVQQELSQKTNKHAVPMVEFTVTDFTSEPE